MYLLGTKLLIRPNIQVMLESIHLVRSKTKIDAHGPRVHILRNLRYTVIKFVACFHGSDIVDGVEILMVELCAVCS